jgi:hypothetical protein
LTQKIALHMRSKFSQKDEPTVIVCAVTLLLLLCCSHRRLFHQFVCPIIEQYNRDGGTKIPFDKEECQRVEAVIENFSFIVRGLPISNWQHTAILFVTLFLQLLQ